jgi:hypothetical protein
MLPAMTYQHWAPATLFGVAPSNLSSFLDRSVSSFEHLITVAKKIPAAALDNCFNQLLQPAYQECPVPKSNFH